MKDLTDYHLTGLGDPTIQPVPPFIRSDLSIEPDIVRDFPNRSLSRDYSFAPSTQYRVFHLLLRSYVISGRAFFDETGKANDGTNRIDPAEIIGEYFGRILTDQIRWTHKLPVKVQLIRPIESDRFYDFKRNGHWNPAYEILIAAKPEHMVWWGINAVATLNLEPLGKYFI